MSIGEVLDQLRDEFPDVTISKIRYLESEGLVRPARTETGHRKFTTGDMERLRFVLSAQRDQYLPLRVIRQQLDAVDSGAAPAPAASPSAGPQRNHQTQVERDTDVGEVVAFSGAGRAASDDAEPDVTLPGPQDFAGRSGGALTRQELLEQTEIDSALLTELEQYGLIRASGTDRYNSDDVTVARTVRTMTRYGIEPRHLRAFRASADREIGLLEQILAPVQRNGDDEARARAEDMSKELAALSVTLHTLLVRAGIRDRAGNE